MEQKVHEVKAGEKKEIQLEIPFEINHSFLKFNYTDNADSGDVEINFVTNTNEGGIILTYKAKLPNLILSKEYLDTDKVKFNDLSFNKFFISSSVDLKFTIDNNYKVSKDVMDEMREKYLNKKAS